MKGRIPDPIELFNHDTRTAFRDLVGQINEAETDRELLLLTGRLLSAAAQWRTYFTMVENELLAKMRDFRDADDPRQRLTDMSENREEQSG